MPTTPSLQTPTDEPAAPTGNLSPQPSSKPFAVGLALDHSAFPHVLDCVLSYADPPTLLKLALTSREVRALVEPHLYRHVSVCPKDSSLSVDNLIVHLPCAPYRILDAKELFQWCPTSPGPRARPVRQEGRGWSGEGSNLLARTECVDVGSENARPILSLPTLPMLRILRTAVAEVRIFPPWPTSTASDRARVVTGQDGRFLPFRQWPPVRERIFVTHLDMHTWPPQPSWLYDIEYSDEEEGSSYHASRPSAVLQVSMPGTLDASDPVETARLVLHLHWSGALRAGTDIQIPSQHLQEHGDVVVVLHPGSSSSEEAHTSEGWFATLLAHLVKVAVQRRARVFLVGVEACTDADLGMRPRPRQLPKWQRTTAKPASTPLRSGDEVVAAARRLLDATFELAWCDVTGAQMDACRAMWGPVSHVDDVYGLAEQVSLLTLEEWTRTGDPREVDDVSVLGREEVRTIWGRWMETDGKRWQVAGSVEGLPREGSVD